MARKSTPRKSVPTSKPRARKTPAGIVATTAVRNSAIPPAVMTPAPATLTHDMIARRAYEIYASGQGGSDRDNWYRAERELRQELGL